MSHASSIPLLDSAAHTAPQPATAYPDLSAPYNPDDYSRGRYLRRYLSTSTNGAWGQKWGTCGRTTLGHREGNIFTIMPALCGCWACDLCGVRRASWLKQEITDARSTYHLEWFWTLTCCTQSCTAPESFRHVKHAWKSCRDDLRRAHGRFSFVWTVEATKRGYAHLHLLTNLDVPQIELSHRWETASQGSFVVKVEPVYSHGAANYLAKYCTQQATLRRDPEWADLKGTRAFDKSRDVKFKPFRGPGEGTWDVIDQPYWDIATKLRQTRPVRSERVQGIPNLQVEVPA